MQDPIVDGELTLIEVTNNIAEGRSMWQGMLAVPTESPSPHVWTALGEVMQPVMAGVAVGVAAGALVATAVCVSIPWLRPSRERA